MQNRGTSPWGLDESGIAMAWQSEVPACLGGKEKVCWEVANAPVIPLDQQCASHPAGWAWGRH